MTTESKQEARPGVATPLLGAATAALVAGLVTVLLGALLDGRTGAAGAVVGALLVLGVLAVGAGTVNAVAAVMPSAVLLVALLTYTLQVLVMAVAFVVLSRSGLLDEDLSREWLAGAVIAATLAWLVGHVVAATRLRIPAFIDTTGTTTRTTAGTTTGTGAERPAEPEVDASVNQSLNHSSDRADGQPRVGAR